jgi:hypothetical protein
MSLIQRFLKYTFYLFFLMISACKQESVDPFPVIPTFIAGHEIATEEVLRSIPAEYIVKARTQFHIAYQHTSHGTHVSYGIFGLQDYKSGDGTLFAVSNNDPQPGKLDFRDYALAGYAPPGVDAADLSRDETAFIQTTRNFLDDPDNSEINVVMWSWCNIAGHDVEGNYLTGMDSLINEYGPRGSRIGTGPGQRINAVQFIFMTGHANQNANSGSGNPESQAELILEYCRNNNQFCLDYYGIDSHCMAGKYWPDAGDNGNSDSYGGNYYEDWQRNTALGVNYYENKNLPGGSVTYGAHNTQHLTANRKAYAFWWILARMAGWEGN